jgi:hypothetical protein
LLDLINSLISIEILASTHKVIIFLSLFIGQFAFFLGQISYTATQQFSYEPVMWSEPESLYVNYQWAEYDSVRYRVYLLMGNENSPDRLQARIYTYDIAKRYV